MIMTIITRILHAPSWFLAQIIFVIAFFQVDSHISDICGAGDPGDDGDRGDDDDDAGDAGGGDDDNSQSTLRRQRCH